MVPWYRLVGAVSNLEVREVKVGLPYLLGSVATAWYGSDSSHLASRNGAGEQARQVKTVKAHVRAAAWHGSDRRLPDAVMHSWPLQLLAFTSYGSVMASPDRRSGEDSGIGSEWATPSPTPNAQV